MRSATGELCSTLGPLMNLLRLQQVHLAYGDVAILDDVNLQIDAGDRVAITPIRSGVPHRLPRLHCG